MYSVCQTTHPATTVEHSVQCKFYNLQENNLVVAGANQLNVYRITKVTTSSSTKSRANPELEYVQTFQLYGTVASLQRVTFGSKYSCKRDSLVISFHDAKLSIVEYNPEIHDLKTVSMHYFEDETLRDGCVTNHIFPPIVRVDPENRCIAMLVYGRHIVVIPIERDEEEDLENELYNTSSSSSTSSHDGLVDEDELMTPLDGEHNRQHRHNDSIDRQQQQQQLPRPSIGQVASLKPAVTPSFKSPVLPSYKIDLSEETCGEKVDNIVDIQFLHNYNDPTLVILHEPTRTWSGRVAMRQDTFSMVALSMNVHQRLQPIIWTVNNLPYDSLRMLPVPKPIGGLLVLCCNELIYLNQSVPAFGMSFNSFTGDSSTFPFNDQDDLGNKIDYVNISLDLSQAVFLNHNKILFILKDGDVYLVTLFNDDMRSIKNFHFERIASTVQPNCLTLCENNLLFIGSHVGDSVLAEIVGDLETNHMDAYDDEVDSSISVEEKETISLYEHDRLLSSSASGRICYGEAPSISENLHHDNREPYIELITTAGHHKNGSICVFQRTIKPFVDDTYELKDCGDLWTMRPSSFSDQANSRLLLNREYETMVFSTKGELLELKRDECAFDISEPTIFASNMGEDNLTLQVMSTGAQLISNDKVIDHVKLDGKICDACVADPHIIALTTSGSIFHLQLRSSSDEVTNESRQYGLSCHDIGQLPGGRVISFSLYKDLNGLFTCKPSKQQHPHHHQSSLDQSTNFHSTAPLIAPTYWLLTVDDQGVLNIISVPNFDTVYSVDNFPSAPIVLADNVKRFVTDLDSNIAKTKEILMVGLGRNRSRPILFVRSETELVVYEAYSFNEIDINNHLKIRFKKIHSLLLKTIIPTEAAVDNNNVSLMDSQPSTLTGDQQLAITDGRQQHQQQHQHQHPHQYQHHLQRDHRQHHQRHQGQGNSTYTNGSSSSSITHHIRERYLQNRHWLREFRGIGGYNGVFLAGLRPYWFIMTDRGALRMHPMTAEGAVFAFSQYDNDNFIYFNENKELRIARLPIHLNLDAHWPVRKLAMKETVHFVNYHVERKVYCVVTSSPSPCLKIMKVGSEPDTMKIEDLEREHGYIPPTTEKFKLKLYDPEKWEEIPDCEIEFEEWEQVTCVKNVSLASEGTTSGLKGYIAISTNYCYGEDVPNRGRIWILDLIEVVPEPDRPLTKNKIKKVYCQEQKGPVTTLSHTSGLLMSAVGQKIYLWQLKEEQLDGVAFIDTQIYIHCASSVKNLILVSDVCKSVSLLRYQQETRTLSMVCRDSKPLEVFACDFAVDNELLNFVVTDSEKNIIIYAHEPENEESHGGTRLLRRADYHLGAFVTSFCRLRGKVPSVFVNNQNEALHAQRRHITMFCTVDGAIGYLFPVYEAVYRRFMSLQNEMTMALPHPAGLNPKAWRSVKQARPSITNPCKLIIDGDVITRFLSLSTKERNELTKKIGTSTDKVLADIQLIQESTMYF